MGDFNDDEMGPPTWMDKEFFEMVLRKYEKDDTISINGFKITPGSEKGDHFASVIYRVVTEYSSSSRDSNSRSMIVKIIPEVDGFKKEILEEMTVFETEIGMYAEQVPKFEDVLRKHGDNTQLCSKVLYHSLEPRKVIIFEDLVAVGYDCVRDRYINEDEVKACLSKIAKWHAVSYKLAAEGDESVKKFEDGMLAQPKEELPLFITGGPALLADVLSKVKGLEMYAEKIRALDATLIPKCNEVFHAHKRGHKGLMVLNHGDLHARNLMFKFDADNKLEDVMMIDFQISCYAPAVVDIAYSIFMIFSEEMRRNHREELIYYYFSIFLETLKKIEYAGELPTLADFYIDLYRFKAYELWVLTTFLPLVHTIAAQKGEVHTEEIFASADALNSMYTIPSFIEELKWLLPRYLHNGFLE